MSIKVCTHHDKGLANGLNKTKILFGLKGFKTLFAPVRVNVC